MSCKHSDNDGVCVLFGDDFERPTDDEGNCLCEDDLHPEDVCDDFEER